ncbi:MAG: 4-hydroxy-tetrahydrodipicolinate synthase, partial [Eggerthellaceae bacterium]|nr:4-hydroxy-tetrahydrodipicolinate synthase [Eggerthellaceae bacterium]
MPLSAQNLQGSLVALITPFTEEGAVDYDALAGLIDFHLENKTKGLVILGTTGESSTMSHEEDDEVCRFTVDRVAGRIPVIAGSGSNSTETMLEKSLSFQKMGVDGLLIITPYYNKSNTEGMYQHFKTVLDAVDIPCILYNVPSRTGCSIPVSVVERLANHPNALGIKEASGSIQYATSIAKYISEDFLMFSGNDDMVVPILSLGASGVISVWANVMPNEVQEMVDAWFKGDINQAKQLQLQYLELIDALFCEV